MTAYEEAVTYIEGIVRFAEKHSLSHTRAYLETLGSPDRSFPVIHVAGTNGKGSVCAYLHEVFGRAGLTSALFTSPHLVRHTERFRIGDREVTEAEFVSAYRRVRETAEAMEERGYPHPSYFEFLFLMGMLLFAEAGAEIAVLETGLGGRLDATNVVEAPALTVITSVSMDHMQYLGNTLPEIAREKAGIIKPGVPCVCGIEDPSVKAVIASRAGELGAPCCFLEKEEVTVTERTDSGLIVETSAGGDGKERFFIAAQAPYQAENAALAVLALKVLAHTGRIPAVTPDAVREGLAGMRWEGRMEEIRPGVFLDGAHNEDGIRRFAEGAALLAGGRRAVLLFSAVSDKAHAEMAKALAEAFRPDAVIVTEAGGKRKTGAGALQEAFRGAGITQVRVIPSLQEALGCALELQEDGLVFICGSLYLVGEIKEILG